MRRGRNSLRKRMFAATSVLRSIWTLYFLRQSKLSRDRLQSFGGPFPLSFEILTLYVAVLAAVQQPNKVTSADWTAFWGFLVATPVVVWLVYGAKVKAANKPLP